MHPAEQPHRAHSGSRRRRRGSGANRAGTIAQQTRTAAAEDPGDGQPSAAPHANSPTRAGSPNRANSSNRANSANRAGASGRGGAAAGKPHRGSRRSDAAKGKRPRGGAKTAASKPATSKSAAAKKAGGSTRPRLRTVRETSAGGIVVQGLEGPRDKQCAALIGRTDRRGRILWSLPKGHIELGETAEQTAIREIREETGIDGSVLARLGSIDYWFVADGRRIHKTVHHYLLRFLGGELSDEDIEVTEVAWVPLTELGSRLAYADERRLAHAASELLGKMADGPYAAAPARGPRAKHRPRQDRKSRDR
jgi:8-oxo-dGTP pyrophosphatase MutT (NUDIX family)